MSNSTRRLGARLFGLAVVLLCAAPALASEYERDRSSDPFEIESAYWNTEYSRLTVRGKGREDREVVVTNAGSSGTLIGTDSVDHDEWRVRVYELAKVPCRVRATQSNGETAERNVKYAPANCDDGNGSGNGGGGGNPPPPSGVVSINSTSQSCGSADVSGNDVACSDTPVPERPYVGNSGSHTIVAINDLGMHCGDLDTRISSILPPFQVLLAQVLRKGEEPEILGPDQVDVYYSAVSNPNDPILGDDSVFRGLTADGSVYKTNFWDYPIPAGTYDAFYPASNPFDPTFLLTPLAGPPFNVTYDVSLPVPNVEHLYIGTDGILDGTLDGNGEFLAAALQDMPGIADP
jgi:hypothetical protein